jgi:copper chaperone CopZ
MRFARMVCMCLLAIGCSQSSENQFSKVAVEEPAAEAMPAVFNAEGAPTVAFSVPDMMCEHSCVPTVRETLAGQPGVTDVKVDLEAKTATVAVDKDEFDADKAIAALKDRMFTNTELVGETPEKAQN